MFLVTMPATRLLKKMNLWNHRRNGETVSGAPWV